MPNTLSAAERAKLISARAALDLVKPGMKLGLGTGSTANWFVRLLAERVREDGLEVVGVPTSHRTRDLAARLGIQLTTLDDAGWLDLTVDGADEFDADLNLIKGGGGAHLMEKIVATASDQMVVISDDSKEVAQLGAFPLPVEVIPFGLLGTRTLIERALEAQGLGGTKIDLRGGDAPYQTDQGNYILDLHLGAIPDATALAAALNPIAGVVEHGLFINIASSVIVGYEDGKVRQVRTGGVVETSEIALSSFDKLPQG